jgi:hypothetical protein
VTPSGSVDWTTTSNPVRSHTLSHSAVDGVVP